jgi:hypothetical protein
LYVGGVRENEDWNVRLDPGTYDAVLGDSYQAIARAGLGFQRSQNAGRVGSQAGPAVFYYKQLDAAPGLDVAAKEQSFFDGIDTTLPGLYRALRRSSPPGAIQALSDIDREIQAAIDAFQFTDPSGCVPALARALRATGHAAVLLGSDPDVKFVLGVKQHQILEAIHGALGVDLTGFAQPADAPATPGPFIAGPAPMGPVVPGQAFEVRASFVNRSPATVEHVQLRVEGRGNWSVSGTAAPAAAPPNLPVVQTFKVVAPEEAITRPRFTRASIQSARYTVADEAAVARPAGHSGLEVVAQYDIAGIPVEIRRPVLRVEANLPYGLDARSLAVVPAMSISLSPAHAIVPTSNPSGPVRVRAEIVTNKAGQSDGLLTLKVPAGWTAMPAEQAFSFTRAGERAFYEFEVKVSALGTGTARLEAVARAAGREYREGYETIRHRDLDTRHLFRQAVTMVRGVDVRIAPGLRVGYVMGIGDDVPAGIAQLGADVQLLGERDLASGDLTRFHAIITGTRAYAVRDDLRTYNRRLLDYVRAGGNLIVLYNTQELVPNLHAPYPGDLPRNAEEVSEEDSAVEILAADAPVLTSPNRITPADFDGWVEQRGSKFWSAWDPRYAPLIATWDTGQSPQKGGWLHARYGRGHYTYFAYAFHRQLPYGVPGAYRLLANLLSLNSSAGAARR